MEVINNKEKSRFEYHIGDRFAIMEYNIKFKKLIIAHTEVPAEFAGQGIGKKLVQYALHYAEKNNLLIIAICSFTESYLNKHPEYNHLRDVKK